VAKHPPDRRTKAEKHLPEAINNQHDNGGKASANEEGRQSIRQTTSFATWTRWMKKAKAGTEAGAIRGELTTTARTRRIGAKFGNDSVGF